jgi:hypothetical protein
VKFVPVTTTLVAPAVLPVLVPRLVTVGTNAAVYVNWSLDEIAETPLGVVTVTSTTPVPWSGDVAVIWIELLTAKLLAATPPKETAVAPVKLVPFMTTLVPPAVVPVGVPRLVTAGAAVLL